MALRTSFYLQCDFSFSKHSFDGDPQAVVIAHVPPSTDHHPSPPKPKRSPNYLFQKNSMIKCSLVHMRFLRYAGQVISLEFGILNQQIDRGEKTSHAPTETVAQPCRLCGKPTTNNYANIPICPECATTKRLN